MSSPCSRWRYRVLAKIGRYADLLRCTEDPRRHPYALTNTQAQSKRQVLARQLRRMLNLGGSALFVTLAGAALWSGELVGAAAYGVAGMLCWKAVQPIHCNRRTLTYALLTTVATFGAFQTYLHSANMLDPALALWGAKALALTVALSTYTSRLKAEEWREGELSWGRFFSTRSVSTP